MVALISCVVLMCYPLNALSNPNTYPLDYLLLCCIDLIHFRNVWLVSDLGWWLVSSVAPPIAHIVDSLPLDALLFSMHVGMISGLGSWP